MEESLERVSSESLKGTNIGVIGPFILTEKLGQTLKQFPTFVPHIGTCSTQEDFQTVTKDISVRTDVLLFTDPFSYYLGRNHANRQIPVHFVPLTGTALYRALYKIRLKTDTTRLSTDSIGKLFMNKVLRELDEQELQIVYYPRMAELQPYDVLQFHLYEWETGRCSAVLTGIECVSRWLDEAGIPNELILPTEQDMIVSLERALLSTESRRHKESQIVVGIINIDDLRRTSEKSSSEHDVQRMKLDIHRILLEYVESWKGHLTALGGTEYLFVTTRGIFETVTGGYKSLPLAREIENRFGLSLSIGVGFGASAFDAGTHARLALGHCIDGGGNMCFIVREDKSVIGPLELAEPLAVNLSLLDVGLLTKAEAAGLSAGYLAKLVNHVTRIGKLEYTARELASILQVTVRTTHRLLLSWVDAGLVEITGTDRPGVRGRPTQIYKLSCLANVLRS